MFQLLTRLDLEPNYMNPALIASILKMILTAEPAVVQTIHDLLVNQGGESDQAVLTSDLTNWDAIVAKAQTQLENK
jgi:hypothetical protein